MGEGEVIVAILSLMAVDFVVIFLRLFLPSCGRLHACPGGRGAFSFWRRWFSGRWCSFGGVFFPGRVV